MSKKNPTKKEIIDAVTEAINFLDNSDTELCTEGNEIVNDLRNMLGIVYETEETVFFTIYTSGKYKTQGDKYDFDNWEITLKNKLTGEFVNFEIDDIW